jgi:hypothetical protein
MIYINLFLTLIFFFCLFSLIRNVYIFYRKLISLKEIEENREDMDEYNENEIIQKIGFTINKKELIFNLFSLSYIVTFLIGIFIV